MSNSEKKDSSCCLYCCCCFNICCPQEQKKRVAGVEYELVPSTSEGMIFNNIPTADIMKGFSLPQDKMEYGVSLSLNPQNEKRWIRQPITAQPKPQHIISEPNLSPGFNPSANVVESPKMTLLSMESTRSLPTHLTTTSHYKQISMPDELGGQKSPLSSIDDVEEPLMKFDVRHSYFECVVTHRRVKFWEASAYLYRKQISLEPCVEGDSILTLKNRRCVYMMYSREYKICPKFYSIYQRVGTLSM